MATRKLTFTIEVGECKYTGFIDRETDGRWIAEITELPGVMSYGDTLDEAINNAVESARLNTASYYCGLDFGKDDA